MAVSILFFLFVLTQLYGNYNPINAAHASTRRPTSSRARCNPTIKIRFPYIRRRWKNRKKISRINYSNSAIPDYTIPRAFFPAFFLAGHSFCLTSFLWCPAEVHCQRKRRHWSQFKISYATPIVRSFFSSSLVGSTKKGRSPNDMTSRSSKVNNKKCYRRGFKTSPYLFHPYGVRSQIELSTFFIDQKIPFLLRDVNRLWYLWFVKGDFCS